MNRVVYSQLTVATIGVTAHHLIKKHEEDENGYGAWSDLWVWYDGDDVKNETAYSLSSKFQIYLLTYLSKASQYINYFLTSF